MSHVAVVNPLVKVDAPCELMGAKMRLCKEDAFYLRQDAAKAYQVALDHFKKIGYTLIAVDAYRPLGIQKMLYDSSDKKGIFVKEPEASNHPKGLAVDVTLWKGDKPIEFQSDLSNWGPESYADRKDGLSEVVLGNRALLQEGMLKAGFQIYQPEWWHFDFPSLHEAESSDDRLSGLPSKEMDGEIQKIIRTYVNLFK